MNSSTHEIVIFCMNIKDNTMATNFEPEECMIFIHSTKIGTHENKGIHSKWYFSSGMPWYTSPTIAHAARQPYPILALPFLYLFSSGVSRKVSPDTSRG